MIFNINTIMVIKVINTMYNMIRRLEATKEHNNIEKIKSWHFEFRQVAAVGKTLCDQSSYIHVRTFILLLMQGEKKPF